MKLRTNRNPVAKATFKALGAEGHAAEIEEVRDLIENGTVDGGETNYPRMYPLKQNEVTQSILDTHHSLFLTSMIMRNDFYKTLSPEVQAVIKDAAIRAGRKERETTIMDGEEAKARLIAEGVAIRELTLEEKTEFIEKTKVVYDEFEPTFTPGLLDKIRKG